MCSRWSFRLRMLRRVPTEPGDSCAPDSSCVARCVQYHAGKSLAAHSQRSSVEGVRALVRCGPQPLSLMRFRALHAKCNRSSQRRACFRRFCWLYVHPGVVVLVRCGFLSFLRRRIACEGSKEAARPVHFSSTSLRQHVGSNVDFSSHRGKAAVSTFRTSLCPEEVGERVELSSRAGLQCTM